MTVSLENPILNSPFRRPSQHWELDEKGMPTGDRVPGRRDSAYIMPIPQSRRGQAGQQEFAYDVEGAANTRSNDLINNIRQRVDAWRDLPPGQWGVTYETQRLLTHWHDASRERPLFFCQVEAAETVIWLTEVAPKHKATQGLAKAVTEHSEAANPGLERIATKLATGAGKTTVMAMLIAWHAVNKARRPNSKTFTDAFLIVTPGITIKDRLRVLMPEAPDSIYERLSIVPRDMMGDLRKARIVITNYHAFQRRKTKLAPGTAEVLRGRDDEDEFDARFRETDGAMIQRVMQPLMGRRGIIVINDEAHHCYQAKPKPNGDDKPAIDRAEEESASEAKADAESNNEAARVWINGIRTVASVLGVKSVYDLSATPFFLRGSGYREGELFGWVVSDFSLMDAIESGIVKVPRVPTRDDVIEANAPIYRHIYKHIRQQLSRRGRRSGGGMAVSDLPEQLEAALKALYRDYVNTDQTWAGKSETPPVFIVVCNNTTTSKMVYEWIAGYCVNPDADENEQTWRKGELELFSNVDREGKPLARRRTILIDSAQLESGDALSDNFRAVAADEIDAFKKELRQREPSRDVEKLDDADLLREVMNTVGRKGKLGEQVRCIVSVSMLTEGWDANTVTHVLGCRAFGTQLLCEQVVGRALRRTNYDPDDQGMLAPQYAEVLGVPFSFMPANSAKDFKPPKTRYRVFADKTRPAPEIRFPRLEGYRVEFPKGQLQARFTKESRLEINARWPEIPESTVTDPLIGASNVLRSDLDGIREQTVAFMLAKRTLERWSRLSGQTDIEPVTLFPQFLRLARDWLSQCLDLKDGRSIGYLALTSLRDEAVERMVRACAETLATAGQEKVRPVVAADPTGSTRFVDFHTTRPTLLRTDPAKSQVNYVLWESTWEAAFAERIEQLARVRGYVKNNGLNFEVPYTFMGDERSYRPDFIVAVDDGHTDPLLVVAEIKGYRDEEDKAKRDALTRLWLPAVNNDGRWGRWQAVEIVAPTDMMPAFEAQALNEADDGAKAGVQWRDQGRAGKVLEVIETELEEAAKRAQHPSAAAAA